eukprot:6250653-Amphidinium_carterae.1
MRCPSCSYASPASCLPDTKASAKTSKQRLRTGRIFWFTSFVASSTVEGLGRGLHRALPTALVGLA